jgi:uncharacterized protein (DUF488 family)
MRFVIRMHSIGLLIQLGGLRHARPDSINMGWRNASFRGYADYVQTDEFESALRKLIELSKRKKVVLMCAESLPWKCHRSLIADALFIRKIRPIHIFSATISKRHTNAKFRGKKITYPEVDQSKPPSQAQMRSKFSSISNTRIIQGRRTLCLEIAS